MRSSFRLAGLIALAFIGITCTDAPTGTHSGLSPRHLTFSPSFTPEAAEIFRGLSAFGIEVTEVRIRLTAPDGTVRDTVIAFPPGVNELTIDIPVPASATGQVFTALLEMRDENHTVLFSGSQSVTATVTGAPSPANPPVVVVTYTGPGRTTNRVTVAPANPTVPATATLPVTATGFDLANAVVPDLLVRWTSSDAALAVVTSTGNTTGSVVGQGRRGTATIAAITPSGLSGVTQVTFVPAPARVIVISGGGQTGVAGSTLPQPFVVEVQATDNLPVPGATVNFRAVTAGGAVTTATMVADAAGRATTNVTLGQTAGAYTYEATSGSLAPVTVSQTATPAPPAGIVVVSGDGQADSVGRPLPLPLVVRVTNAFGAGISGVPVNWTRSGSGVLSATSSTTGADGTTSVSYTLGNTVGNEQVIATTAGVSSSATFTVRATARSANAITIVSGGGQSGKAKTSLPTPLVARVVDGLGNPVSGASVTWTASGAPAAFSPATVATNADGQASTTVTFGSKAGALTVTASVGSFSASAGLTILAGAPATLSIVTGDGQSAPVGTEVEIPPRVLLSDVDGNPVASEQVVFAVASGGGSVTGATQTTDGAGIATVASWTLGAAAGPNTLTASVGLLHATFSATGTSTAPTKFIVVTGPPASITVGAAIPAIRVRLADAANNPVNAAGVVVTLTGVVNPPINTDATPGGPSAGEEALGLNGFSATGTTDATGLATLTPSIYRSYVGTATITVSSASVTSQVFSGIPVVAGAPAQLVLADYPSSGTLGSPLSTVQVVLADAGRNLVGGAGVNISAAIATGGGTLGGTTTLATDAQGRVSFTNLTISGPAGPRTLVFTASGLTSATTGNIAFGAGAPATISKNAGDGQTATAGSTVSIPPSVQIRDASGNPVPNVPVTFAPAAGSGSVTGGSVNTNGNGIATVGTWTLSATAGPNSLAASAGALSVTFTATGTSGSASKLVILNAPPATIKVGSPIPQVRVQLADGVNNPVPQEGVNVTLTVAVVTPPPAETPAEGSAPANAEMPPGDVSVTVATDANGVATFNVPPYVGPIGQATVTISASGFTAYVSPTITVVPGDPAGLAVLAQPPATGTIGTPLQPATRVAVVDVAQNRTPAVNVSVVASIGTGGGTLGGTTTVQTDAQGQAVFGNLTISGSAGPRTLAFSASGLTGVSTNSIAMSAGAPATVTRNAGDGQSAAAGSAVSIPPSVLVRDGNGNPVPGVSVTFAPAANSGSVTGGTASTDASGIATVGSWTLGPATGPQTLTATIASLSVSFSATATAGASATMTRAAGDGQTAIAGSAVSIPPSVLVQDANGNPVAGVPVTFTPSANSGTVTGGVVNTNANGIATVGSWTLSTTAGPNTLTATSGALVASFFATGTSGNASKFAVLNAPPATIKVGEPIPQVRVQLADAANNPARQGGVSVTLTLAPAITPDNDAAPSGPSASAFPSDQSITVATDANGVATFTIPPYFGPVGQLMVTISASGVTSYVSPAITVTPGNPAGLVILAQAPSTGVIGARLVPSTRVGVVDAAQNRVNAQLNIGVSIATGGGTLTGTTTVQSDPQGQAIFDDMFISGAVGARTLGFSAAGLTGVTTTPINLTAGAPATIARNAGDGQSAAAGSSVSIPPSVLITDASGNPVPGVSVNFVPGANSGSVAGGVASTNASGIATVGSWTLHNVPGPNSLVATAASLSTTFSATGTVGSASKLVAASAFPTAITVGVPFANPFAVRIADALGNPVPQSGVTVTLTGTTLPSNQSLSATAVTDGSGVATFALAQYDGFVGTLKISFTAPSVSTLVIPDITVSTGAAKRFAFRTQPSSSVIAQQVFPQQPVLQLVDAGGNPVSTAGVSLTASLVGGAGTLNGTTVVSSDASGGATYTNLAIAGTTGPRQLVFQSSGLESAVSAAISVNIGAAATIAAASAQSQSGTVNQPVATNPSVQVRDAYGNNVPNVDVTFTPKNGSRANGSTSPVVVTTNAAGTATLSSWTLGSGSGTQTVDATASLSGSPVVFTATASAGAATRYAFVVSPPSSAPSGEPLTPAPSVQLVDGSGNPVGTIGITVTASILSGGGTLSGTTTASTDASGVATFPSLRISGTAGSRTLQFSDGTRTPATANVTVTAGTAAKLAISNTFAAPSLSGVAFATQPTIQILDANDNPVASSGHVITAVVASGPTSPTPTLSSASATTNSAGAATFSGLTLTGAVGTYTLTFGGGGLTPVTSAGIPLSAGAATTIAVNAGNGQSATAGTAVPIAPSVKVTDASGNPVSGVSVTFNAVTAGSTIRIGVATGSSLPQTTNISGIASVDAWTLGSASGPYVLTVSASVPNGSPVTFNATANAGAATKLKVISSWPTSVRVDSPNEPNQFVVQLADAADNIVRQSGVVVNATIVVDPSGTTVRSSVSTDANGQAIVPFAPYIGPVGTMIVTIQSDGLTSLTSPSIPVLAGAAKAIAIVTQPSPTAASGAAFSVQPVVQLVDAGGNATTAPGERGILASIASGGGTLSGVQSVTVTDNGRATFTDLAISGTPGSRTLQFASTGLTSVTSAAINVTTGAATKLVMATQPSATGTSGVALAQQPSIQVTDAAGNAVSVPTESVCATITNGGGTLGRQTCQNTDPSGRATFNDFSITGTPGVRIIKFTVSSGAYTEVTASPVELVAGPASKLAIVTPPPATAFSGAVLNPQPVIRITDAAGNSIAAAGVSVVASLSGTTHTLSGTTTATTNASGVATFTNLAISGNGTVTMQFAAAGLETAVSGNISVGPAPAQSIAVNVGTTASASGVIGTNMTIPIIIDMAAAQGLNLASMTFDVTWNPAQFDYVSRANGSFGESPSFTVNTANTSTGRLAVSVFDNDGFSTGSPTILTVTLSPKTATTGSVTTSISTAGSADGNAIALSKFVVRPYAVTTSAPAASSIETTTGLYVARLPRQPVASGVITFTVKNGANQPMGAGYVVSFTGQRDDCGFPADATTNASGVVTLAVTTDSMRTGCVITASANGLTSKAFIATAPYAATHVWFGGTTSTYYDWDRAQSWVRMSDMSPTAPSSAADVPYIAAFYENPYPRLSGNKTVAGLLVASGAQIDLNGFTLTVNGSIDMGSYYYGGESERLLQKKVALPRGLAGARSRAGDYYYGYGSGYVVNGTVIAQGTVNVRGVFDKLTIGGGNCGGASPEYAHLDEAYASGLLTVVCGAIAVSAEAQRVVATPGSFLKIASSGYLYIQSDLDVRGDSLVMQSYSYLDVAGETRLAGRLAMDYGTYLYVGGAATFAGYGSLSDGDITIGSHMTFGGAGSAGYQFTDGSLWIGGNLTQINGSGAITFKSSGDHYLAMTGSTTQTISLANPVNNTLGKLYLDNVGGVALLSDLTLTGSEDPYIVVRSGPFTVPTGKTFTTVGTLFVESGATVRADGAVSFGSCYADDDPRPLFSGSGTVNGGSPAAATCVQFQVAGRRIKNVPTARSRIPMQLPSKR